MTGQARCCGSVGSANRLENQRSMTGWNRDSGIPEIYPKTDLGEGLTQRGPAHRDDPLNRLADLVVRRRRPRRDADRQPAIRQPAFPPLLGGRTDRVEGAEVLYERLRTPASRHALGDFRRDGE